MPFPSRVSPAPDLDDISPAGETLSVLSLSHDVLCRVLATASGGEAGALWRLRSVCRAFCTTIDTAGFGASIPLLVAHHHAGLTLALQWAVGHAPGLRAVEVRCPLPDVDILTPLVDLPALSSLRLIRVRSLRRGGPDSLSRLAAGSCAGLLTLGLSESWPLRGQLRSALLAAPSLTSLDLDRAPLDDGDEVATLLPQACPYLRTLSLSHVTTLSDVGLSSLSAPTRSSGAPLPLVSLRLSGCHVRAVAPLGRLPRLERLDLAGTHVSDTEFCALITVRLRTLNLATGGGDGGGPPGGLSGGPLAAPGSRDLSEAPPRGAAPLRSLSLAGCPIGDASLVALLAAGAAPQLEALDLSACTKLSDARLAPLVAAATRLTRLRLGGCGAVGTPTLIGARVRVREGAAGGRAHPAP